MKKSLIIIITFIIMISTHLQAQTWSQANRLTWKSHRFPPDGSKNATIVVDSKDNIYIFYQASADLFQKKSTDGGVSWLPIKRLTWDLFRWSLYDTTFEFKVKFDSNDNIYIFFVIEHDLYFKKSSDGGTNWQPLKRLTWMSYSTINEYKVLIDSNNNIYLVWYRSIKDAFVNYEIFLKKSTDGGNSWSMKRLTWDLDYSKYPEIVADSNDNIYVFWVLSGWNGSSFVDNIFYKKLTNGSLNGFTQRLTWTSTDTMSPKIAIDSSNNLHVVWSDYLPNSSYGSIFHKKSTDGGLTWSARTDLINGYVKFSKSRGHRIIVDTNDIIHVIFPYNLDIILTKSDDGGATWSELKSFNLNMDSPDIELDYNGNFHIVWNQRHDDIINIFYIQSTHSGSAWSTVKQLSWTTQHSLYPDLSIDSNNNLHLVWQQIFYDRNQYWYEIYYKNRKQ